MIDEQHKKDIVDASRALIRWLCIKMDDPIILIFDLIILSVMTAIHSMFRFIKQLRPDEKRQLLKLSYDSFDFYLEEESFLSVKVWSQIFVEGSNDIKNRSGEQSKPSESGNLEGGHLELKG